MQDEEFVPLVERLIREAQAEGEFDDLEGSGKPISDLDRMYEPGWWARRFAHRQRLADAAVELVRRVRRELPRALSAADEASARRQLEVLNADIARLNAGLPAADRLAELDVEGLLVERRGRHSQ